MARRRDARARLPELVPAGIRRFSGPGGVLLRPTRVILAAFLVEIVPPGCVLDVGAWHRALVDALRGRGREALDLQRVSHRDDVLAVVLDDLDGRFAAIVFWHSLEHLRAPAALSRMRPSSCGPAA